MTTPPMLRIFRGLPAELADEADETSPRQPTATPFYAVMFSGVVHLLVLGSGSIAAAIQVSHGGGPWPAIPERPLHTIFVAFILAQCGLGAVLFARSSWSLNIKAIAAVLTLGALWLLLVGSMQPSNDHLLAAQTWASSIAILFALVIAMTSLLELALHEDPNSIRSRFGLLHLLVATTLIAVALGVARNYAIREGFALADVLQWTFFQQVQLAGCTSAAIAAAIYASLRMPKTWMMRFTCGALVLIGITVAAPLAFLSTFGKDAGATLADMRWLFGSEGLFLLGTLVPLQMLGEESYISK